MELKAGDKAPDFEMQDADGKLWRLADLRDRKTILYFYPADSTPGCTAQACDFRDSTAGLSEAGYRVLGVSPQGESSKRRFIDKYDLNFPLLIDEGLKVADAYGATKQKIGATGRKMGVLRSTFIVSEDGTIERAMYGVNARGHVSELLQVTTTS